jgi:hypothetical protein
MPVRLRTDLARGVKSEPFAFKSKSAAYTMEETDEVLLVSGATTITLPAINADHRESYLIINTNSSDAVTVATPGSETINGAATISVAANYGWAELLPEASNWYALTRAST